MITIVGSVPVNLNLSQIQISRDNDYRINSRHKLQKEKSLLKTSKRLAKDSLNLLEDNYMNTTSDDGDILTISREGFKLSIHG